MTKHRAFYHWHLLNAKAISMREAFSRLKELNMGYIHAEIDALRLYQGLQSSSSSSTFDLIISDNKEMVKNFSNISFLFAICKYGNPFFDKGRHF